MSAVASGHGRSGDRCRLAGKKAASAVNNKRNVRQKITPVGTRKSTSVRPLSVCEVKVDLPTDRHACSRGVGFLSPSATGGTEG